MEHEPMLQMGSDRMLLRYAYHKPFTVTFHDKSEWQNGFNPDNKGGLVWYTDGSNTNKGTAVGVCRWGSRRRHNFRLGLHTTVFQAEIYAIKVCIMENIRKGYTGTNIYILSDSQAAIRTLDSFQINSKLVWDCHQSLVNLAKHKSIQLVWVPGHMGIDGNETADQLATQGSSHPLTGPDPALCISAKVATGVIRDGRSRKHKEHWQSTRR
jgi:ribonuclease HI